MKLPLGRGMQTVGILGFVYSIYCALALFTSALTLASFIKVMNGAFLGRMPQKFKDVRDPPLSMKIPMVILAGLCVAFGIYPQGILRMFVNPAVASRNWRINIHSEQFCYKLRLSNWNRVLSGNCLDDNDSGKHIIRRTTLQGIFQDRVNSVSGRQVRSFLGRGICDSLLRC